VFDRLPFREIESLFPSMNPRVSSLDALAALNRARMEGR
jgi:hypothetical protein